jgi:hypothetical protein
MATLVGVMIRGGNPPEETLQIGKPETEASAG